jgi:hypothetical protein
MSLKMSQIEVIMMKAVMLMAGAALMGLSGYAEYYGCSLGVLLRRYSPPKL